MYHRFRKFNIISRNFFHNIRPKYSVFINGIIPILTVFLFTTITIIKLRITAKRRNRKQSSDSVGRQNRRDFEIVRQMIVVCSIFVTCAVITSLFVNAMLSNRRVTMKQEMTYNIYQSVVFVCQSIINSANFYMYIVFGQKFRNTLTDLLRMKFKIVADLFR